MEKAQIFLCTSNKEERWAVVINEAMNSGCAINAYKYIGAVPFLIGKENGLCYLNFKDFYKKTKHLIDNKEACNRYGKKAYNTIKNYWTAKIAANNFDKVIRCIIENKENSIKEGVGSTAQPVK